MKLSGLIAGLFAVASIAFAESPAPAIHHSLSLHVNVVGSGGAGKVSSNMKIVDPGGAPLPDGHVSAQVTGLTTARSKQSAVGLHIEVRNFAQIPDQAKVEWYFVGEPTAGGQSKQFIFDSGTRDLSVNAGQSNSLEIASKPLTAVSVRALQMTDGVSATTGLPVGPVGVTAKTGSKLTGWIVRLLVDGKVSQVQASSPNLETLGKDDATLAAVPRRN